MEASKVVHIDLSGVGFWFGAAAIIVGMFASQVYDKAKVMETCEIVSESSNELRACVVGLKQVLED